MTTYHLGRLDIEMPDEDVIHTNARRVRTKRVLPLLYGTMSLFVGNERHDDRLFDAILSIRTMYLYLVRHMTTFSFTGTSDR